MKRFKLKRHSNCYFLCVILVLLIGLASCDDGACSLREAQGKSCEVEEEENESSDREAPTTMVTDPVSETKLSNSSNSVTVNGTFAETGSAGIATVLIDTPPSAYEVSSEKLKPISL